MIEILWKIATLVFYIPWATVIAVVFYIGYYSMVDGLIVSFGFAYLFLFLKGPK